MTAEELPKSPAARTTTEPVEATSAVARKNLVLGLALTAVAFLMATGAVLVALIYLHYD